MKTKQIIAAFAAILLLAACSKEKGSYSPCGCIPSPSGGDNQTIIPGLYFGVPISEAWDFLVKDTVYLQDTAPTFLAKVHGLVVEVGFTTDQRERLDRLSFRFPYGIVSEDSIPAYVEMWNRCITSVYGEGCWQRIKLENGWSNSNIGYWLWDICEEKQLATLSVESAAVSNSWHPARSSF